MRLEFKDNNSGHNDIVLSFGGKEYVSDSYFLALDRNFMPETESSVKIRAVLKRLLEQWLVAVKIGVEKGVCFLPYAFFDQCTCWLKCEFDGTSIRVSHGWAEIEGWSFYPSDFSKYSHRLDSFNENDAPITMELSELTNAINQSISQIA